MKIAPPRNEELVAALYGAPGCNLERDTFYIYI